MRKDNRSNTRTKKLDLATQTVRTLDTIQLAQVPGGVYRISVGLCD